MIRPCYHRFFIIISFWLLLSCSSTELGSLTQTTSAPQLPTIEMATMTITPQVVAFTATPTTAPVASKNTPTPLPLNLAETILLSPDGKWAAYFYGYHYIDHRLSVANFDATITWNVNQANLGAEAWFTPYRWSQDSRYLYFNIYVAIDGYVPFYQGAGLQRLDVLTGTVSEILSSGYQVNSTYHVYNWNMISFSLSPDDKQIAYTNNFDNEAQLVIRDMKTGNEKSLFFKGYSNAGSITWSPQQDQLALAVTKGTNWSNTLCSVELVEVDSLTPRTLVKDEDWVFDPIVWTNNHTILLKERGGHYLYLDITTEKLSPAPDLITFSN